MTNIFITSLVVFITVCPILPSVATKNIVKCSKDISEEFKTVRKCPTLKWMISSQPLTDTSNTEEVGPEMCCQLIDYRQKCKLKKTFKDEVKKLFDNTLKVCKTWTQDSCNGLKTNQISGQCEPYLPCDIELELRLVSKPSKVSIRSNSDRHLSRLTIVNNNNVSDQKLSTVLVLWTLFLLVLTLY